MRNDTEHVQDTERAHDTEQAHDTEHERGDVPGWVLVTLMTAGLVVALWAMAGPLLEDAFRQAIGSVTGQG